MAKREQVTGAAGETFVLSALSGRGLAIPEKIGTPVKLITIPLDHIVPSLRPRYRNRLIATVVYGNKVSGDTRGLIAGSGRSVLVETKTVLDHNLRWSNLRKHQPGRLDAHAEAGGLSLLAWLHATGLYLMQWPVPGFGLRKSITPEQAASLDILDVTQCQ